MTNTDNNVKMTTFTDTDFLSDYVHTPEQVKQNLLAVQDQHARDTVPAYPYVFHLLIEITFGDKDKVPRWYLAVVTENQRGQWDKEYAYMKRNQLSAEEAYTAALCSVGVSLLEFQEDRSLLTSVLSNAANELLNATSGRLLNAHVGAMRIQVDPTGDVTLLNSNVCGKTPDTTTATIN